MSLSALWNGLLVYDEESIHSINEDPDWIVATVADKVPVKKGERVAGIRIVPLIMREEQVRRGEDAALPLTVFPFAPLKTALVTTGKELAEGRIRDGFAPKLQKKLAGYGASLMGQTVVGDEREEIAAAIRAFLDGGGTGDHHRRNERGPRRPDMREPSLVGGRRRQVQRRPTVRELTSCSPSAAGEDSGSAGMRSPRRMDEPRPPAEPPLCRPHSDGRGSATVGRGRDVQKVQGVQLSLLRFRGPMKNPEDLLKERGIRPTELRKEALRILFGAGRPLSWKDTFTRFTGKRVNKVSLYRTLSLLEEKGLVHKILGTGACITAPISLTGKSPEPSHFLCLACSRMICLGDQPSTTQVPGGVVKEAASPTGTALLLRNAAGI